MTVHRNGRTLDTGYVLSDTQDKRAEFVGRHVADRIGDVERRGSSAKRRVEHLVEKLRLRAPRILGTELDLVAKPSGKRDHPRDLLLDLSLGHPQLVFTVDGGGRKERMKARPSSCPDRFERMGDVGLRGTRETAHG